MSSSTKPSPEITRAAERYLEQYGDPLVTNTYLKVTVLVLAGVCIALSALHAYMKYENYVTRFSFPYFDMPIVASDFDLRDTPDDKLPYDPRNIGAAKPQLRPLELKPEANVPTPRRKSPRTETEIVAQESDADRNLNAQQSLNLRG